MRAVLVLLLFLSLSAFHGRLLAQSSRFSEARQLIQTGMKKDSLPGLAIAVAHGDSILWEEGFGWADRDKRVPVTVQTPFYLASVSKTILATAAMVLREKGRLGLDQPVKDLLGPAAPWSVAFQPAAITPHMLATHTSGLTTFDLVCPPAHADCPIPSFEQIMRRWGVVVWKPGERFDYSNLGFHTLGQVVAHAAGRDLADVLRDEVFQPLGMTHSSLGVSPDFAEETAVRYAWVNGALPRQPSTPTDVSSVYGSARDLIRFGQFHAKARVRGQRSILSDASIDTMQLSVTPAGGTQLYGLGWWVEKDRFGYRTVLAQGGTDAAQAWLRIIPSEHIAVVVLANKGVGFLGDVIDAVIASILPPYANARAASPPRAGAALARPGAEYLHQWMGITRADGKDIPLAFAITDSGTVTGTFGSRSVRGLAPAWVNSDTLLRFNFPGDLSLPDTAGRLAFYLRLADTLLYGTVTTRPPVETGISGQVSYWVSLHRRE